MYIGQHIIIIIIKNSQISTASASKILYRSGYNLDQSVTIIPLNWNCHLSSKQMCHFKVKVVETKLTEGKLPILGYCNGDVNLLKSQ